MSQRHFQVLTVTGVVLLALGVLLPALHSARESARRASSRYALKSLGLAAANYHDTYNVLPAGGMFDSTGQVRFGWGMSLALFLDASPLYCQLDQNQPWDSPRNAGIVQPPYPPMQNPGKSASLGLRDFSVAHYSANAHLMSANHWVSMQDLESPGQTFLMAELGGDFVPWASPYNWRPLTAINTAPVTYGRDSRNGCQFLLADGQVKWVSNAQFPPLRAAQAGPDLRRSDPCANGTSTGGFCRSRNGLEICDDRF